MRCRCWEPSKLHTWCRPCRRWPIAARCLFATRPPDAPPRPRVAHTTASQLRQVTTMLYPPSGVLRLQLVDRSVPSSLALNWAAKIRGGWEESIESHIQLALASEAELSEEGHADSEQAVLGEVTMLEVGANDWYDEFIQSTETEQIDDINNKLAEQADGGEGLQRSASQQAAIAKQQIEQNMQIRRQGLEQVRTEAKGIFEDMQASVDETKV